MPMPRAFPSRDHARRSLLATLLLVAGAFGVVAVAAMQIAASQPEGGARGATSAPAEPHLVAEVVEGIPFVRIAGPTPDAEDAPLVNLTDQPATTPISDVNASETYHG